MMRIVVYLTIVALCWQFELTNSRTSTLWKLNEDSGKITGHISSNLGQGDNTLLDEFSIPMFDASADVYAQDEVFYIIASTMALGTSAGAGITGPDTDNGIGNGSNNRGAGYGWVRESPENSLESLGTVAKHCNESGTMTHESKNAEDESNSKAAIENSVGPSIVTNVGTALVVDETLDCKPVNFTYYDYLIGVGQRFNHPKIPEPEVAYIFLKTKDENSYKNFDITALERRLKRAKREKPRSVQLYNQIGNYWRIIGDARQAIECFRRALAMSPTNAEVLLNLARVLYNLQYLDDAIHLTRRSLEMQPPGRSAWQQYFTLGEIFKAYGHFQESILHLRHALELYPQHEPILKALRDVENNPSSTLHVYTVLIIVAL
ncbi:tetratricopeptide repeat protein 17-like isoform X2 [Rhagoletis pomonella]|nr:tetratricopeptide repeat protein 17-like isoform X2 [Rhagoletis pomonella]